MPGILHPYMMGAGQGLLAPPPAPEPAGGGLLAMLMGDGSGGKLDGALGRVAGVVSPMLLNSIGERGAEGVRAAGQGAAMGFGADRVLAQKRAEDAKAKQKISQTMQLLAKDRPDLVPWVESGAISPADAFNQVFAKPKADGTDDIKEYQFAVQQGYKGNFRDYMTEMKKAGAMNVDARQMGTIPPGYQVQYDPQGRPVQMTPIPGGPAANDVAAATAKIDRAAGQAAVSTRVVTTAAQRAREAAGNRALGPYGQGAVQFNPYTDAAEVARQVEVMKSQAKVENLTAMRMASPTGGALGGVTEKEAEMLAAKSGALDPSSPNFARDLDDYELTLLQVVHGPAEGQRIFDETRPPATGGSGAPARGGPVRLKFNPATGELE